MRSVFPKRVLTIAKIAILFASLFWTRAIHADPSPGNWTWLKGALTANQSGIYGTQGIADEANTPGARSQAVSWTGGEGTFWLFGGEGYGSTGGAYSLNDLWKYDPATGNWTWMKGASTAAQWGAYGTQGVADTANTPGARYGAVSWTDSAGTLWLFGGCGMDGSGTWGSLNDLWKYDPLTGNWTWVKGASTAAQWGTYGTQGLANTANMPGARYGAVSWMDRSGVLWIFGGHGWDSVGEVGYLNDMWKYDTISGNWTWMKGASTVDQLGIYGTLGIPDGANTPGGRISATAWTNDTGTLWLFGGHGKNSCGEGQQLGRLNDLWKYNPATGNWTWVKGCAGKDQPGTYGTQGVADVTNTPGGRLDASPWTDKEGVLWLLGGEGYDGVGAQSMMNDLWKYDPTTGNWTWMRGASTCNQSGTYGTLGIPEPANMPGARRAMASWVDNASALWLFGGYGRGKSGPGSQGYLNDLWKYDLPIPTATPTPTTIPTPTVTPAQTTGAREVWRLY